MPEEEKKNIEMTPNTSLSLQYHTSDLLGESVTST